MERRLPIALQFVTFGADQRATLKKAASLPANIEAMMTTFHKALSEEERADPKFAYRVAFVPKTAGRPGNADVAVEFVQPGSEEAEEINRVLLKEVERPKYRPGQIVQMMREDGYPRFNMTHHTNLWQGMDAKADGKGFGVTLSDGQWYWYQPWLDRVRAHCEENAERYR